MSRASLSAWLAAVLCAPAQTPKPVASPQPPSGPRLAAAAQRNENVQVHRIDNDAIKEANIRLGANLTFLSEVSAQTNYYAADHGRPAAELPLLAPRRAAPDWHAELYHDHQNSVFNARTFFQAGPVKPSRRNFYGWRAGGPAGLLGQPAPRSRDRELLLVEQVLDQQQLLEVLPPVEALAPFRLAGRQRGKLRLPVAQHVCGYAQQAAGLPDAEVKLLGQGRRLARRFRGPRRGRPLRRLWLGAGFHGSKPGRRTGTSSRSSFMKRPRIHPSHLSA